MHSGVFGAISRLCSHLCPASPPGVSGTKIPQGQACPQAGCGLREGCGETVRAAFGGSPLPISSTGETPDKETGPARRTRLAHTLTK